MLSSIRYMFSFSAFSWCGSGGSDEVLRCYKEFASFKSFLYGPMRFDLLSIIVWVMFSDLHL